MTRPACARALTRVLEDRDLATRLGRAGRNRFDAEFTTDRMIRGHVEVYEGIGDRALYTI